MRLSLNDMLGVGEMYVADGGYFDIGIENGKSCLMWNMLRTSCPLLLRSYQSLRLMKNKSFYRLICLFRLPVVVLLV